MDKQDELRQWLEIADNDLAYAELGLLPHTFPVPLTGRKILGKGEKHDLFYV